jgi:hypothetical protein
MWFSEYVVYAGFKHLNKYFRGKVHQALYEKIMKPDTSQDSKWTWLQVTHGLKHEAIKLHGPEQKMQELARQVPLSKPWRKWRQKPAYIGV